MCPIYTEDIKKVLYEEDIRQMWAKTPYEEYRLILSLLWFSAARPSEIINLQRKNVNWGIDSTGRDFFAMKLETKKLGQATGFVINERILTSSRPMGSQANIYIETIVKWCLKNRLQLDDYLIVGGRTTRWLNRVMHRLSNAVGHTWSVYAMRHSTLSHMSRNGATATTLMYWKGASDINSVRRYLHAMPAYWDISQDRRGRDLISGPRIEYRERYDAIVKERPATEEEAKKLPESEE